MGKPFSKELEQLPDTIKWSNELNIDLLTKSIEQFQDPVYIVGSGGSFSACIYAADLFTHIGLIAKALTPLDLFYSLPTVKRTNIIFISASGKNVDILFAFKKAIEKEPISVINICMQNGSKLGKVADNYSRCQTFEFLHPSGKDGFLATNSLAAFFVIMYRSIMNRPVNRHVLSEETKYKNFEMAQFSRTVKSLTLEINYGTENCQNKSP